MRRTFHREVCNYYYVVIFILYECLASRILAATLLIGWSWWTGLSECDRCKCLRNIRKFVLCLLATEILDFLFQMIAMFCLLYVSQLLNFKWNQKIITTTIVNCAVFHCWASC